MDFTAKILDKNDTELLNDFYINYSAQTNLNINLKLDQSPNIWKSYSVFGQNYDVLAVIDNNKNQIACACVLSRKKCYIQTSIYEIGYVSALKARKEYRNTLAFARFLKLFNEYSENINAVCWLFSVFTDNELVNKLVKNKRFLLPEIDKINIYNSYIFRAKSLYFKNTKKQNIKIKFARKNDIPDIMNFIEKTAEKTDLIPNYSYENIANGSGILKDFLIENLVLAFENNKIIGMAGSWNQTNFRRWIVESYSKKYLFLRPIINIAAKIKNMPNLPKARNSINYKIICLLLIENDNPEIFKILLNKLIMQEKKTTLLSTGFLETHDFNIFFRKKCLILKNNLYIGYRRKYFELVKRIRKNNLYIEQGGL